MELEYKLRFDQDIWGPNGAVDPKNRMFFIGFKNSLEALSRYDIYVNANKLYSQSWVGQESFIYNAGIAQTIREKNPYVYTCWKNASQMSHDVCGVYVNLEKELDPYSSITVKIPVKINLHQILMLSSVRYLPSFCGRWEIELYPNWSNLVVLPIPLSVAGKPTGFTGEDESTVDFTQIGKKFRMLGVKRSGTAGEELMAYSYTAGFMDFILSCNEGRLTQCLMNTTTFQLHFEVYEGLRQMYAEQPLIIPTNILTYGRFSGEPAGSDDGKSQRNGTDFHATLSQSLENCDSIFFLIPFDNGQTTCFYQPYLKELRLSLGEFGTRPGRYVQTWDDPRFFAMVLDALNLETSEITSMNEDVARSLNTERTYFNIAGAVATKDVVKGDKSNFFIGFSLSQVGFQSGTMSSPNTNVPFIFDAVLDRTGGHTALDDIKTSVIVMFLIDAALMIQVVQDSDVPIVKLTSKSIV
jgi:hypothetical protein